MSGTARTRGLLALTVVAGAATGAVALAPAFAVGLIAAVLFDKFDAGMTVMQLVFTAIASVVVRLALGIVARVAAGSAALLLARDLRAAAAKKIGTLALGDLAAARPGAFESLLLDDVDTIVAFVAERLPDIASAAGAVATAFAVLALRDRTIAFDAAVIALGIAIVSRAGARRVKPAAERDARDALGAAVFAAVRTLDLDRSLPDSDAVVRPVPALARAYRAATEPAARSAATRAAALRALAAGGTAAVVIIAAWTGGPHASPALLVLVAALGLRLTPAWTPLAGAFAAGAPARHAFARFRALLARPPAADGTAAFPVLHDVRFRNVSFAYPDAAGGRGDVLRDVDFVAEAGTVTAFVGPSGSGKTTVTRLAARFWDVERGAIEIGGIDVRAMPLDALMKQIAFVFQDVMLLNDTIAENLRLGRPGAGDDELERAARACGAHAFIEALPAGYRTVIGERGTRLSRGERQRLQIARAILKDAPIVVLDEPTASMDPATEAAISRALVPLVRGKTVLVVAHRLSTVVDADRIVVLARGGRVEAVGRHADVLAASATYAELWADYTGTPNGIAAAAAVLR